MICVPAHAARRRLGDGAVGARHRFIAPPSTAASGCCPRSALHCALSALPARVSPASGEFRRQCVGGFRRWQIVGSAAGLPHQCRQAVRLNAFQRGLASEFQAAQQARINEIARSLGAPGALHQVPFEQALKLRLPGLDPRQLQCVGKFADLLVIARAGQLCRLRHRTTCLASLSRRRSCCSRRGDAMNPNRV